MSDISHQKYDSEISNIKSRVTYKSFKYLVIGTMLKNMFSFPPSSKQVC